MRILALGDVVGTRAIGYLEERLWSYRREKKVDLVVANGENATEIRGLCARDADRLLQCGVDVITLGNHAFGQKDLYPVLDRAERVIRPANYPHALAGLWFRVCV